MASVDPNDPLRSLTGDLSRRRATTPGEHQAARWLMEAVGRQTHQVWLEPFRSFRSARPVWALLLSLALTGGVLTWTAPQAGLALALLAALGFAAQALGWLELGWLFPCGESQNVVGVVPSRGEIRERVVVVAHYDTGPRLWTWPAFIGVALSIMLLPLAAMLTTLLGAPAWSGLPLLPICGLALGLLTLFQEGAEGGNAAGVAAALEVGRGAQLEHTEIWTVFTGSRAPGLVGIRAFVRRHDRLLAGARFIILEEEEGAGATLWQRRGEASVVAERGHMAVALLTVDPAHIGEAAARVRALAEEVDRGACD